MGTKSFDTYESVRNHLCGAGEIVLHLYFYPNQFSSFFSRLHNRDALLSAIWFVYLIKTRCVQSDKKYQNHLRTIIYKRKIINASF